MKSHNRLYKVLVQCILLFVVVVYFFPFVLLIVNSFKSNGEIHANPFSLPTRFDLSHLGEVVKVMNFAQTFTNSFVVSAVSLGLILLFSSMCAYYLVRHANRFNRTFFSVLVASMIIPFQSLMIPLIYIYGGKLGLIQQAGTEIPLLIFLYAGFGSPMSVFIYHGFIKSIPLELEEASRIDGCTQIQTFFRIVAPMLKPTTTSIFILNALWIWNDYLLPSLVLTQREVFTMPIQMKQFNGTYFTDMSMLIPAMLMTILPLVFVYLFAQKSIIEGVTQGSVKG
jgi:raffinose/stachyose/melibiose transport system permease protein